MGNEVIKVVAGTAVGSVIGGGVLGLFGALSGTISGSAGAAIMQAANHTGYDITEAAQMGAIGSGLLTAYTGVLIGGTIGAALGAEGLFKAKMSVGKKETSGGIVGYTCGSIIGGLIGYGILNHAEHETIMRLEETAITFAVGGLTTCIPLVLGTTCIAIPIALAYLFYKEYESDYIELPSPRKNYGSMDFKHYTVK